MTIIEGFKCNTKNQAPSATVESIKALRAYMPDEISHTLSGFYSLPSRVSKYLVLRHSIRKRYYKAFTLIELLLVTLILGTLAAIGIPMYQNYLEKNNTDRSIVDIREIESKIVAYQVERGAPPNNLGQVGLAGRQDPWGRPYEYLRILGLSKQDVEGKWRKDRFNIPINSDFDLYSKGHDGNSQAPLTAAVSRDDIVRANNGAFVGLGSDY